MLLIYLFQPHAGHPPRGPQTPFDVHMSKPGSGPQARKGRMIVRGTGRFGGWGPRDFPTRWQNIPRDGAAVHGRSCGFSQPALIFVYACMYTTTSPTAGWRDGMKVAWDSCFWAARGQGVL
jgi:hypothetical protein